MQTIKQEALNAISRLPDSVNLDDIMYRLFVLDKIKKGQESHGQYALDRGNLRLMRQFSRTSTARLDISYFK